MNQVCDNLSVGVLIHNEIGKLLLIERKKFPFGFAPPAGHVDEFPSKEDAARGEVEEEVGLRVLSLELLLDNELMDYPCRREGGTHHVWSVFRAQVEGKIYPSKDETKSFGWYGPEEIKLFAKRAVEYKKGGVSESEYENNPGLDPVWVELFTKLSIIP